MRMTSVASFKNYTGDRYRVIPIPKKSLIYKNQKAYTPSSYQFFSLYIIDF